MTLNKTLLKKFCIFALGAANLTMGFLTTPVAAEEEAADVFLAEELSAEEAEQASREKALALAEKEKALEEKIQEEDKAKNIFTEVDQKVVFIKEAAAKDTPDSAGQVVKTFQIGDEATLTGISEYSSWKVEADGQTYYVNCHTFEEAEEPSAYVWNGPKLSKSAGVNTGPTGKETYYNLDMSGVINTMRAMGNNDPYWVREDGVKMLGDYVIVAANLSIFPRGSLVPCSLGMAIVCDTGGFAAANPYQLDIATAW